MRYEHIEHTADIMVRCYGSTIEDCYVNAAFALFDQMVDMSKVCVSQKIRFEVSGDDDEERLYAFLSELLFIFDADRIVFKEFSVIMTDNKVICEAGGEQLDILKHRPKVGVKAITYHMMNVDRVTPSVTVLFDV